MKTIKYFGLASVSVPFTVPLKFNVSNCVLNIFIFTVLTEDTVTQIDFKGQNANTVKVL